MQSHFILFISTNIYEKSRENNCVPSEKISTHCGQGVLRRYIHSKVPFNFSPLEVMTFVNKNNICSLIDNVFAN